MMNRGVEIRVVTDGGGQREFRLGLRHETFVEPCLGRRPLPQNLTQGGAQRAGRRLSHRHQMVQAGLAADFQQRLHGGLQPTALVQRPQIQDLLADGNPGPEGFAAGGASEHAQGKVLDRKISTR